jgi:hypothetical protein
MLARWALLLLEPLHQSFFMLGFFEIGSGELFALGWLQTAILLISASSVARITGMNTRLIYVFHTLKKNFW